MYREGRTHSDGGVRREGREMTKEERRKEIPGISEEENVRRERLRQESEGK